MSSPTTGAFASGKRIRRKRDPNAWESTIPSKYVFILCLGMSYPNVKQQILKNTKLQEQLYNQLESVEQAVELVRRGILTEMDGRDLARCLSLESKNEYLAYTVSMQNGIEYTPRHLSTNFNRSSSMVKLMRNKWGRKIRFKQIILDYFWIPSGEWMLNHWKEQFFTSTIPSFVTNKFLLPDGVVFLPFCLYCFYQVIANKSILLKFYDISFLYKDELHKHALWKATNDIDPIVMQTRLGKAICQEDTYCRITKGDFKECGYIKKVRKETLLKFLRQIEDFHDVRMIQLKVFSKDASNEIKAENPKGRFVGLKSEVERGFDKGMQFSSSIDDQSSVTLSSSSNFPSDVESKIQCKKSKLHSVKKDPPSNIKVTNVKMKSTKTIKTKKKGRPKKRKDRDAPVEVTNSFQCCISLPFKKRKIVIVGKGSPSSAEVATVFTDDTTYNSVADSSYCDSLIQRSLDIIKDSTSFKATLTLMTKNKNYRKGKKGKMLMRSSFDNYFVQDDYS